MKNLYGQLDLTVLGKLVRQHSDLVKTVIFKDGEHQLINIDVFAKRETDKYDNVAVIKASCKKDSQKEGLSYYIANLKESKFQDAPVQQSQQAPPPQPVQQQEPAANDDLPFSLWGVAA